MMKLFSGFKKKAFPYHGGNADFGGGRVVYDKDIAKMLKKHMPKRYYLDTECLVACVFMAFDILNGSGEKPKGDNWKF